MKEVVAGRVKGLLVWGWVAERGDEEADGHLKGEQEDGCSNEVVLEDRMRWSGVRRLRIIGSE